MVRLSEGDRAALEPLYRGLWPRCVALAERMLGDRVSAEDAGQQALMRLVAQAADYDPSRNVVSWALTLVAWECRTQRQRIRRRREVGDVPLDRVAGSDSPEDVAIRAALVEAAREALHSLSVADQQTLELAFSDAPVSMRPVAPATFRKRRQRAITRLRAAWSTRHDR